MKAEFFQEIILQPAACAKPLAPRFNFPDF